MEYGRTLGLAYLMMNCLFYGTYCKKKKRLREMVVKEVEELEGEVIMEPSVEALRSPGNGTLLL